MFWRFSYYLLSYIVSFIVFCAFLLFTYFKDSIFWTLLRTGDSIHHITIYTMHSFNILSGLYSILNELQQLQPQDQWFQQPRTQKALIQILPLLDEFLTEVREQLTVFPSTEQALPIQEIQQECCDSQVYETEQFFTHTPHIFIEHTYAPLVVCNDHTFTEFIQGEERCLKFISQDLTFLQSSSIPSTFSNISNTDSASAKVKEPRTQTALPCIQRLTRIPQENTESPPTQTIKPVLGFTPTEIHWAQAEPKLTVEQLLETELCHEYVKTPLQTLDGIYVHQPKWFLPLAKEAKKLAEEFRKEQVTSQWSGIPHEKLLQESFVEQLNSLQILDQLVPLKAAKEHLSKDIINILELLGKADNIPFNQLYNLAEDCMDRYYTKVIKTLTQLLKSSFNDRQLVFVNMARALKFLASYVSRQTKLWKVLSKYDRLPDHFHNLQTTLQTEFSLLKKANSKNIENLQENLQQYSIYYILNELSVCLFVCFGMYLLFL